MRVADLLEAEGRSLSRAVRLEGAELKTHVARLGLGAGLLVMSALLVMVGVLGVLYGLFLWLQPLTGTPASAALTGVVAIIAGGVAIWKARAVIAQ
ncbi:MAG TPA: phage holin family protein [Phycisphaerales bacterium]